MNLLRWICVFGLFCVLQLELQAQESIAQTWTEHLLFAVKNDFARPTVHARNLFHSSVAMHDAWAAYDGEAPFYFLGQTHEGQIVPFNGVSTVTDTLAAQHEAISYAMYRLMSHRFQNSPGASNTIPRINAFMDSLNYDRTITSLDYLNEGPAALGNYIAAKIIEIAYLDGSNEINNYANLYYTPIQNPVEPEFPGNPSMIDPNRWQPIALSYAVDQAGNVLTSNPPFLSPEWGNVTPFALPSSAASSFVRNGDTYKVYHDPGPPAFLDTATQTQLESLYKWNFTLVSVWQSHLDPEDTTIWDISPASVGNIQSYPTQFIDYDTFYDYYNGGDAGQGYTLNPKTNMPYTPQLVKRADYARVLAEFWADGLDSETPPGHWYNIYNEVREHPLFENKWKGVGPELDRLEYDVKAYMTIGGAMHDAAISAWSIKGWYDYARPVSALRYMAERGQSTIDTLSNYHPAGLPLVPGYIEIVEIGDSLAGASNQHVGKIKLFTWRGPDYIPFPDSTYAGVGWILAENWWPYQRPSFVTPPFAGYVSGHSTFSRAAAEVMTFITGDPFFPGGMSSFIADENEFLEFEEGPSSDIVLEWATYRDASDQCSLSRIWGGIHPPVDDINGRLIGLEIGLDASAKADSVFSQVTVKVDSITASIDPVNISSAGSTLKIQIYYSDDMNAAFSPTLTLSGMINPLSNSLSSLTQSWLSPRRYEFTYTINNSNETISPVNATVLGAVSQSGVQQLPYAQSDLIRLDMQRPELLSISASHGVINDDVVNLDSFYVDLTYSEDCDTNLFPLVQFITPNVLNASLIEDASSSGWINPSVYRQAYSLNDDNTDISNIEIVVSNAIDLANNIQNADTIMAGFDIHTTNPGLLSFSWSDSILNRADIGVAALQMNISFDRQMNVASALTPEFSVAGVFPGILSLEAQSAWIDSSNLQLSFNLLNQNFQEDWIDISLLPFKDLNGNSVNNSIYEDALLIDTKKPEILDVFANASIISDNQTGGSPFLLELRFDENMNTNEEVIAELFYGGNLSQDINFKVFQSSWLNDTVYQAYFEVDDNDIELQAHELRVNFAEDAANNPQDIVVLSDYIDLDTRNPQILSLTANTYELSGSSNEWEVLAVFDEQMDTTKGMELTFPNAQGIESFLHVDTNASHWINESVYQLVYNVVGGSFVQSNVDVLPKWVTDTAQNEVKDFPLASFLRIDLGAVGIKELNNKTVVFPLPVQGGTKLNFNIARSNEVIELTLFNDLGQKIEFPTQTTDYLGNGWIEIPDYLEGIYFLNIINKSFSAQRKILVIK